MDFNETNNQSTAQDITPEYISAFLDAHPECEQKAIDMLNSDAFSKLFEDNFKKPVRNCMQFLSNYTGDTFVYSISDETLRRLGFPRYRDFVEYQVADHLISDAINNMSNGDKDFYTCINESFSRTLDDNEFSKYIASIVSDYAHSIGRSYTDLALQAMAETYFPSDEEYDESDELEPS